MRFPWRALGVSGALLFARSAAADVCPVPADAPALATADASARSAFLARTFDREIHDVDVWSWTWGSVYTAGVVAESVAYSLVHDHGTHVDLAVGVASTAFGAVTLVVLPLKLTLPMRSARRGLDSDDRCAAIARAEKTLESVAESQALATGPLAHIGNVAINGGIALILGLGYGRWPSAAISAGVGLTIGEANVLTQPHHLKSALARYKAGALDSTSTLSWTVAPFTVDRGGGVALGFTW